MNQRTIAAPFQLRGVGIHTGASCRIEVAPAKPDAGRTFIVGDTIIPALADRVVDTRRCTVIGTADVRVRTVEHLLSALHGLGIDNAVIRVAGPEIPILDGSAIGFVEAIMEVGIVEQDRPPRTLTITAPLEVRDGSSCIRFEPHQGLSLNVTTTFDDWPEGSAALEFHLNSEEPFVYATTIAPARTFAMQSEVEMLLAAGLAKGGSLDNALIITPPDTFSTPLRVPYEWCAHKMLDLIGDLALAGSRLNARVTAVRPGHRINTLAARRLLELGGVTGAEDVESERNTQ